MVALDLAVQRAFFTYSIIIAVDNRVRFSRGSAFGIQQGKVAKRTFRFRQFIDTVAAFFAFAAADSAGVVK